MYAIYKKYVLHVETSTIYTQILSSLNLKLIAFVATVTEKN